MFAETRRLSSPTGALLAYHHQEARGSARAHLVVCHGLAEHASRYRAFAQAMAERGYGVYAHDHRGHGETRSTEAPIGSFADGDGADKVIEDVLAIREVAVSENPALPVILFGHSMGGLVALNTAIARPDGFQGLALWNSNFNTGLSGRFARLLLSVERMLRGSDTESVILPKATFGTWSKSVPDRRTDFDWLSRDAEQVEAYVRDPLCGFGPSIGMWDDVLELTQRPLRSGMLERLPRGLPIHLVGGSGDPATRGGKDVRWLARQLTGRGFSAVTTLIHQDMRHETLNEIGREAAIADFAAWCDAAIR